MKKVNRIGLDYDHTNIWKLVVNYFKIKYDHPDSKVDVYISPSGRGFHIKIHKEVSVLENLFYRAKYDDCSKRLKLAMSKLLMDKDTDVDILFDKKGNKKVKKIDIENLIGKDRIEKVLKEYGSMESFELMVKIAEDLKKKIKFPKLHKLIIEFDEDYYIDFFNKIGEEYYKKTGYRYEILENRYPYSKWIFVVYYKNIKSLIHLLSAIEEL